MPFHEVQMSAKWYEVAGLIKEARHANLGNAIIETHNGFGVKKFPCPVCNQVITVKIFDRGVWHPKRRLSTIIRAIFGASITLVGTLMYMSAKNGLHLTWEFGCIYHVASFFFVIGGSYLFLTALWDILVCPRKLEVPGGLLRCWHTVKFVGKERD